MTLPAPQVADRKVSREKLAQLLRDELVGDGLPVDAVYEYQIADFGDDKDVAVIVVSSAGSDRTSFGGFFSPIDKIYLAIHLFVLYSRPDEWTDQQSEDALDLIESGVSSLVMKYGNRESENDPEWTAMDIAERTTPNPVIVGGKDYRHETIIASLTVPHVS